MEYLFICYAGINRSPIAVDVARSLARKYNIPNFKADFLGIVNVDYSHLDSFKARVNMADIIFALDSGITKNLIRKGISPKKICNLDIEDIYPIREYPQLKKELERILTLKLEPFFRKS